MTEHLAGGVVAAPLSMRATAALTSAFVRAARQLLADLERGRPIDAAVLCGAMEAAFGPSDTAGGWNWKIACDACKVTTALLLRKPRSSFGAKTDRNSSMATRPVDPAETPGSAKSTINGLAGLLLPVWKWLPKKSTRVYRLENDVGERIIGCSVSAAWVANALATCAPDLTPNVTFAAVRVGVLDRGDVFCGVQVTSANRIELSEIRYTTRDRHRYRTSGLIGDITSFKDCMFVPANAEGDRAISKLFDQYSVARVGEREVV